MEANSRRTSESRRTSAVVIALVAATVTAGVAFGHHPQGGVAVHSAAAVIPSPAATVSPIHDPSLPDATEMHADPRATAEDSTPTF